VEQSAAAAESMKEQAQGLIATVSVFKLAQGQQPASAAAAAPARAGAPGAKRVAAEAQSTPAPRPADAKARARPAVPLRPQAPAARVPAKVRAARAVNEG
jgi:hypothetical protein